MQCALGLCILLTGRRGGGNSFSCQRRGAKPRARVCDEARPFFALDGVETPALAMKKSQREQRAQLGWAAALRPNRAVHTSG